MIIINDLYVIPKYFHPLFVFFLEADARYAPVHQDAPASSETAFPAGSLSFIGLGYDHTIRIFVILRGRSALGRRGADHIYEAFSRALARACGMLCAHALE